MRLRAVIIRNEAGAEIGRGFAEAVNYADTTANSLRLAGLPDTDEMVGLVTEHTPGPATRARNMLYVLTHHKQLEEILANAKGMEFMIEGLGSGEA